MFCCATIEANIKVDQVTYSLPTPLLYPHPKHCFKAVKAIKLTINAKNNWCYTVTLRVREELWSRLVEDCDHGWKRSSLTLGKRQDAGLVLNICTPKHPHLLLSKRFCSSMRPSHYFLCCWQTTIEIFMNTRSHFSGKNKNRPVWETKWAMLPLYWWGQSLSQPLECICPSNSRLFS